MREARFALRRPGAWLPRIALVAATVMTATAARAEADGPDFLRVTGVGEGSVLNVRSGPGLGHPAIGRLAFDADGIRNLGCEGGPSFAAWEAASPLEREATRKRRWCRIEHGAVVGWAAGWHLGEGNAPDAAADFSAYPNIERWLGNMKKLRSWPKVNEALYGYAEAVKDQPFDNA